MTVDWRDPNLADIWSERAGRGLPTRPEQLDIALSILEGAPPGWILDLGAGPGLVAEQLLERSPHLSVACADVSERMLELARSRLECFGARVELVRIDLEAAETELPARPYSGAIAVQALHNVAPAAQLAAIRLLTGVLPRGSVFVLVDRVAIPEHLYALYVPVWKRLERVSGVLPEPESYTEHSMLLAAEGDEPVPLERLLEWLREAEFDAALVHVHGNRVVIAARRR